MVNSHFDMNDLSPTKIGKRLIETHVSYSGRQRNSSVPWSLDMIGGNGQVCYVSIAEGGL